MNDNRKSERIFEAIGHADEELLERCENHKEKPARNILWLKWGAAAACVCLLAVGGVTFKNSLTGGGSPTIISSGDSGWYQGCTLRRKMGKQFFRQMYGLPWMKEQKIIHFILSQSISFRIRRLWSLEVMRPRRS